MNNRLFLCNDKQNILRAYQAEQREGIAVFDYPELLQNPQPDVEYLFSTWGMPALTEQEIRMYLPKLKAVFYAAGTVQGFARPFLQQGIRVFSAWAANAIPVAEFTVAQIILANKGYFRLNELYKGEGHAQAVAYAEHFFGNYEVKVGLLGAGMIGKKVIELLKPYQLEVLVFDPFLSNEDAAALGVKKASLEVLFSSCTVISNHLANNAETKEMIGYDELKLMPPYATFINTGRGAQIVHQDLLNVMQQRPDCVALLDVTDPYEPLPVDDLYFTCDNIYLSPHRAGSTNNEIFRMGEYMMAQYQNVISEKPTAYEVTLSMLTTMA